MSNLLDTFQATLANANDFLAQPSQQTYDRMLAAAAIHVREDLEEHPNASFHGVVISLIDKMPVLPHGPMTADLSGNVSNMLAVLRFSRNPAAAALPLWNPHSLEEVATDLVLLAQYALAEDVRQVLILS